MVIPHRYSGRYRGQAPDHFTMLGEDDPARSGWTLSWTWSDEPVWNVEICSDCDWSRGKQCDECAEIRALYRRGDYDQQRRRHRLKEAS